MDTVSRLKQFISYLNIPVTQFADSCKIPRPSLSQLLNGRNKKVSDSFLAKLHKEYPALNIVWLLYGEGEMLIDNVAIDRDKIAVQNSIKFNSESSGSFRSDINSVELNYPATDNGNDSTDRISDHKLSVLKSAFDDKRKSEQNQEHEASVDTKKKIVNIIVYYNDNSFESFIPDGKGTI